MHASEGRATCSLHIIVAPGDRRPPDPAPLLTLLGDDAGPVTVVAVADHPDGPDFVTVDRAAELIDHIEAQLGRRPAYAELTKPLSTSLPDHIALHGDRLGSSIVVLGSSTPRRRLRALRRGLRTAGAHLAVVPARGRSRGLVRS